MLGYTRICIVIVCFINYCHSASAQNAIPGFTDSLAKKIEYYAAKKQQGILFAHFDKTVYTNNENVWFTSYLLNANNNKNDVLSAVLVNDNDHSIILKEKFVMDKGISFGNMFLPDTILSGNYSFMLYTNSVVNGQPQNVFTQPITVKNTNEVSYKTTLLLEDTAKIAPPTGRKILLVTNASGMKLIAGATVSYYLGDKRHPIMAGTVKTDAAGQYLFTIPNRDITLGNNTLQAQITYGKETQLVKLSLPVQKNVPPVVRFYPEGGNLSDGVVSVVGWEVKNGQGVPYAATGILYRDDKPVDTLTTNSYGMGSFVLQPQQESRYYVKLMRTDSRDSAYNLPKVLPNAPVVTMVNAVVDDTLRFMVKSRLPGKFYVMVHNYKQVFFSFRMQVLSNERKVKIALDDLPKGLAEITILDSLQRPYAERLFFAHYDRHNTVNVAIDTNEYKTRQKVNLKLNLTGPDGKPVTGAVSIACVQANRVEVKKATDIESYFYLNYDLGQLPVKQNYLGSGVADKAFLESTLLIKGWRRYNWMELMNTTVADTVQRIDPLIIKGTITYLNTPLKKPVNYVILKDSSINTALTDRDGNFAFTNAGLYTLGDKKIHLFVTGKFMKDYVFHITDPYDRISEGLADNYVPSGYNYLLNKQKEDVDDTREFINTRRLLKEVKIKGENDELLYGAKNACGDYYCIFNILDCPNHRNDPNNKVPVKGKMYLQVDVDSHTLKNVVYQGCINNPDANAVDGIHYSMEFYPADYAQLSPTEPEYLSTIYWNSLYSISPKNQTPISFYTSDITGSFKIIVQGVTDKGVVYGERTFVVSK